MRLADKIRQKRLTPYQLLAKKYGVTVTYVGMIARGEREPTKKVGLDIRRELEKMAAV